MPPDLGDDLYGLASGEQHRGRAVAQVVEAHGGKPALRTRA